MSEQESLIPTATDFEKAQSLTSAARRPLDGGLVRDAVDPWTCPAHLLPWLAWSWSIDIWSDEWAEERQRRVIARAAKLHRLKGTEEGLRLHVDLVDGELIQTVVPPQRYFALPTLSKEAMDEWLLTMPQIRVYLADEEGDDEGLSFVGGFAGHVFAAFDAGRALYGRAARIWDRGDETPLTLVDIERQIEQRDALTVERVSTKGAAGKGLFDGRFAGHACAGESAVAKEAEIITYRKRESYNHRSSSLAMASARPSLDPVDVRSRRISEQGQDSHAAFPGRFNKHCYARADRGEWLLYDRIILHDPQRAAPRARAWSFANVTHIGIQPFTAKTVIDAKSKVPRGSLSAGWSYSGNAFARAEDPSRRQAIDLAVRASKSARDKVLVTNKLTRPRTFHDPLPLDGSIRFGDRVPFRL